ncbi:MAG: glycosyltransferase family 2 protein [Deltaproteobacteria bacterium]|nr:glycosyltransferase family 2 protein [Deltaproteobacteria bacterium]
MGSQPPPRISVIIPTYNRKEYLPRAIESVLGQSFRDFELIVVDDGSTDGTAALVAGYGAALRPVRQENRGPAAARNAGIRVAHGALLAFLDSDDWFAPEKLVVQEAAMARRPDYLVSHTDEIWYRRGALLNQKKKHHRPHGFIFADALKLCVVGMSTVMMRREFFERAGLFDEDLPCCEDYDLWLRAAISLPFLKIDAPLTMKAGGRPDQVSVQYRAGMDKFRIKAILKLLDQGVLTGEQRRLARRELACKCRIYGNGCLKHGRPDEGGYYVELAAAILR